MVESSVWGRFNLNRIFTGLSVLSSHIANTEIIQLNTLYSTYSISLKLAGNSEVQRSGPVRTDSYLPTLNRVIPGFE